MPSYPSMIAGVPFASDGAPLKPHQDWDASERCPIGRDPRKLSVAELNAFGHHQRSLLKVIRQNCIDCLGGQEGEVKRCAAVACPMWPYRMGTNPFSKRDLTEAQRAALRERAGRMQHAR